MYTAHAGRHAPAATHGAAPSGEMRHSDAATASSSASRTSPERKSGGTRASPVHTRSRRWSAAVRRVCQSKLLNIHLYICMYPYTYK